MASGAGRLTAGEIYDQVLIGARSELNRTTGALAFSGLVSGMFMGLTGLGVAGTLATLPGRGNEFIAQLFYPLGFIAVVIGRAQLFTENTLFPVVLVLQDRRHLLTTLRLGRLYSSPTWSARWPSRRSRPSPGQWTLR